MEALRLIIQEFIAREKLFTPYDKILVGVSGGPDSMMLLDFLRVHQIAPLVAAHVNYQMRGSESQKDEELVKEYCAEYNIKLYCTKTGKFDSSGNFQEQARAFRYDWFRTIKEKDKLDYIATAHHREDRIETMLFHLFRGTGLKGLTSLKAQRDDVIRPILCLNKAQILDWNTEYKVPYRTDSSNLENKYTRNTIRNKVFTSLNTNFPDWQSGVQKTIGNLTADQQILESMIDALLKKHVHADLSIRLPFSEIPEPKEAFLHHLFKGALNQDEIHQLLSVDHSGSIIHKTNFHTQNDRKHILICPTITGNITQIIEAPGKLNGEILDIETEYLDLPPLEFEDIQHSAYFDWKKVVFPLRIRHWKAGDKIDPLGMQGKHKLVSDILIDAKVPTILKKEVFVVEQLVDTKILWVVGHTISDSCKSIPNQAVLRIHLKKRKGLKSINDFLQYFRM